MIKNCNITLLKKKPYHSKRNNKRKNNHSDKIWGTEVNFDKLVWTAPVKCLIKKNLKYCFYVYKTCNYFSYLYNDILDQEPSWLGDENELVRPESDGDGRPFSWNILGRNLLNIYTVMNARAIPLCK
jgi:hypothetical protein